VDDSPGQQAAQHLGGRLEGFAQQPVPRAAGVAAEAVLERQHEVVVVAAEHAVVEGLPVVGVGASLQQQPGEGAGLRMPGLAVFSIAEYAGEHGEGSGQGVSETAIIGIRASVEEQPGRLQRDPPANVGVVAGVGLVQQRRPAVRSAGHARPSWPADQVTAYLRGIRARGGYEQVVPGQLGMLSQQLGGGQPVAELVVAVGQACSRRNRSASGSSPGGGWPGVQARAVIIWT
jgi:hypothetical protein